MKKGWSDNSKDFINRLLQRRPVKRLGYTGIKELKNHLWLKDIDWNLLKNKKLRAPYIPKEQKEYFDKKYCEEEKTTDKYKNLINVAGYQRVFENYTFINLNYISKLENTNNTRNNSSNDIALNNIKHLSFSESLLKSHNFMSSKEIRNNVFKNTMNKLNRSINKNLNKKITSFQSKAHVSSSTNQLKQYFNIDEAKEKKENNEKKKEKSNEKESKEDKINKIKKTILKKHYFSNDSLVKERTQINLKDIQKLIEKSLKKSQRNENKMNMTKIKDKERNMNLKNKDNSALNNKLCKSTRDIFTKSNTNNIIAKKTKNELDKQITINIEKEKEKEKENNLLNSTTKEKTSKEKTTDNRGSNNTKNQMTKMNKKKKVKINENKINRSKVIKKDEYKYSINDEKKSSMIENENKNVNKKKSMINSQSLVNYKNNFLFHSRNKLFKNQIKSKTGENNQNNDIENKIKVIHKKIYNFAKNLSSTNAKETNKNETRYNSIIKNNSLIKSNSVNNYISINSLSNQTKKPKFIRNSTSIKEKTKKSGKRGNKMFNSKGFIEFRKKNNKNVKEKTEKSKIIEKENLIKVNKDKKESNINNDKKKDKIKSLKFDDYFRNTGLDKESNKDNYYIL